MTNKPFRFTAHDFDEKNKFYCPKACAEVANAKLDAHLASLPRVYACPDGAGVLDEWATSFPGHTHTALLWDVQPIAKAECEHTGREVYKGRAEYNGDIRIYEWECTRCGAKLKPKWEVADE